MLKSFDRYILREVVPPFVIGLVLYSFVLLMNQILLLAELFIDKGVSFGTVLWILVLLIPSTLAFAVPMSVLMGILAGLSRLSSDLEVTAFKTLGVSYLRFLRPILIFAAGGWLVTSILMLWLSPWANYRWVQTFTKSVLAKVNINLVPRQFNESIPGLVIFIRDVAPDGEWRDVFAAMTRNADEPRVILARRGRLNLYPELKRATVELWDGTAFSYPRDNPSNYRMTAFARNIEEVDVSGLFSAITSQRGVREKAIGELWREAGIERGERDALRTQLMDPALSADDRLSLQSQLEVSEHNLRSYGVELHKKFALPFVCFLFVLIGLPLGASTRKGGRTSGFTISIFIILVYYILITAGEKMAIEGRISPFAGMWGPDLLLFAVGAVLFAAALREVPLLGRLAWLRGGVPGTAEPRPPRSEARRWRVRLRFPNILDRYISRKYAGIFALILLSLLVVSIIVTFFERIDNVYAHGKPLWLFWRYLWYRVPEFMYYGLPVAALAAALLVLGLLDKTNEVTAMKACGISLYRLILPVAALALGVSVVSFALQERLLPAANSRAVETWNQINDEPAPTYSLENRHWVLGRNHDRIYHYAYFDPVASVFSRLTVYDLDANAWTLKRHIFAEKASLDEEGFGLNQSWDRTFGPEGRFETRASWRLPEAEKKSYFLKEAKGPDRMTYPELRAYIREVDEMGFATSRLRVDLGFKITFPLVCLIMTLIGVPFAFSMGKRGTLVGIGLSLVIAMVYWGAIAAFRSLGFAGFLGPFLAAWGPNLTFGLAGLVLLFRLRT